MMTYANYRAIPTLVRDRKPFTGNTMSARVIEGSDVVTPGKLSGKDLAIFNEDRPFIRYVVLSYSTPIAWWTGTVRGWYVVGQRFSVTTSKHQGKLYLIPTRLPVLNWDCETEAYALSDCKHWDKPGTECAGPRVGITDDGVILCERHYNQTGA